MPRMIRTLVVLLFAGSLASAAQSAPPTRITGTWEGVLQTTGERPRVGFVVGHHPSKGFRAILVSIDQGNAREPGEAFVQGDSVIMIWTRVNARFRGVINARADTIRGVFAHGLERPLVVHRVTALSRASRPQEPKPPFPYRTQDVTFDSDKGVRLAGTVVLPTGKGPFPAVALLTGSGPHNRDEEVMSHKPFLVLADYLARRGIASLRSDDRGIGKSTGRFETATTEHFAHDADAAFQFLRKQPGIDPKHVGLVGHSEGGLIASMIAARSKDAAFIVLMATPGIRGDSLLMLPSLATAWTEGGGADVRRRNAAFNRKLLDIVLAGGDSVSMATRMRAAITEFAQKLPKSVSKDSSALTHALMEQTAPMLSPWYRFFVAYRPATALEKVRVPVLALYGSLDLQIPARENLNAIRNTLTSAGNKNVEVILFPNLNHLFQRATTGTVNEYATIAQTMSPGVLSRIADWILSQSKKP